MDNNDPNEPNDPPTREDLGAEPEPIPGEDIPEEQVPEPAYTDDD